MKHIKAILSVSFMMVFWISACGEAPRATDIPANTPVPVSDTSTPIPLPTETTKPSDTPEPTNTPVPSITPTSESATMEELIQKLYADKTISSKEGTYHRLDDFSQEWAKLYYYQWWYIDYSPSNFIIQADLEWESASKTANLADSGCGFVYHTDDNYNHHATFLMMDGKVQTYRALNNNWTSLKGGNAGKFKIPSDKAHMVLIVDKQKTTVIINDKQVVQFMDAKLLGGKLGLTVSSGTNKDFGTRCKMTNVELWELPE